MSERVATGIRDNSGFWNHGHTYQAHPIACAAALAVQKVIAEEDLLASARSQGAKFGALLRERITAPNSTTRPFVHDVRGKGCFWAVEFDVTVPEVSVYDFKGKRFGPLIQAKCFDNGLIILGMSGGATLEGTLGEHAIFAPPYNVTDAEIEKMVDLFVQSVEDVLSEHKL